jgi:hypothetical protein
MIGRWTLGTLVLVLVGVLIAGCSGRQVTASPPAPSGSPLPDGFPLGSWTTTLTEADLRAAGMTGAAELTENSGVFTMTLAPDGTWTTAQETDSPIRWPVFRGTYVTTGPDTFRQLTTFPPDFAGDEVDFSWRIESGDLVMEVPDPPDPILPVIIEAHPWEPVD